MDESQQTTLAALKTAIRMEIDGEAYYRNASRETRNEAGRKLLAQLAKEEADHRQVFQDIYDHISRKNEWPETPPVADGGQALRTIFGRAVSESQPGDKAASAELEAAQQAIDMENRTLDYYRRQARDTVNPAAREFYLSLAGQEAEHARMLLDYYEYLSNPAAYFVNTEHPSLDG